MGGFTIHSYEAVLFDLDGTLLNTLQDLCNAGNFMATKLGFPSHPLNAYRKMVGNGIPHLIRRILPAGSDEHTVEEGLSIFQEYYGQHMLDCTQPYAGIPELLARVRARGVAMAVLSNKQDEFVVKIVKDYFPETFRVAMGLREGVPPKPHPASVQMVLSQLGVEAKNSLYVGDSDVDMTTAANAGLEGCGVLWGFRDREELLAHGATHLAASPKDLVHLILGQ